MSTQILKLPIESEEVSITPIERILPPKVKKIRPGLLTQIERNLSESKMKPFPAKKKQNEVSQRKLSSLHSIGLIGALLSLGLVTTGLTMAHTNQQDSPFDSHALLSAFSLQQADTPKANYLPEPVRFVPKTKNTGLSARDIERGNLLKFITGMIVIFRPSSENAGEIARHIISVSEDNDLDPLFVAAIISTESGFRTSAKSSVGALGLMQLRPSTAEEVLVKMTDRNSEPKIKQFLKNPEINIRLGVQYLKHLETRFKGDRYLALSAYNWGPGNVSKALRKGRPIPGSVQAYSKKILTRSERWKEHFNKAQESARRFGSPNPLS